MPARLALLFEQYTGHPPERIIPLKAHASDRQIYRLSGRGASVCGVINGDLKENAAFIYFARFFESQRLPVPEIYIQSEAGDAYLQEDLGDTTLYGLLSLARTPEDPFPEEVERLYEQALTCLTVFQLSGSQDIDYTMCHQRPVFDKEAMLWDMNYFKNSFLNRITLSVDFSKLEGDFETLAAFLLEAPNNYFMYRDFQARNIMVRDGELSFIDFQAGRRGPLQYDVASLLYQSSAAIPEDARTRLRDHYLKKLQEVHALPHDEFLEFYEGFVVMRLLQALGTYGKQGLASGKDYFIRSIKPALNNLFVVFAGLRDRVTLPAFQSVITQLKQSPYGN